MANLNSKKPVFNLVNKSNKCRPATVFAEQCHISQRATFVLERQRARERLIISLNDINLALIIPSLTSR